MGFHTINSMPHDTFFSISEKVINCFTFQTFLFSVINYLIRHIIDSDMRTEKKIAVRCYFEILQSPFNTSKEEMVLGYYVYINIFHY